MSQEGKGERNGLWPAPVEAFPVKLWRLSVPLISSSSVFLLWLTCLEYLIITNRWIIRICARKANVQRGFESVCFHLQTCRNIMECIYTEITEADVLLWQSAALMSLQQGYGGYLTLMMLKSTEKLISCAAAQAPVTDWTMYGERELKSSLTRRSGDTDIFITSAAAAAPIRHFSEHDVVILHNLFHMYRRGNVTLIIPCVCFWEFRFIECEDEKSGCRVPGLLCSSGDPAGCD